jgi:hypothetical protein
MKLFELARGTEYRLAEQPKVPPDAAHPHAMMVYTLGSIDGMYSWSIGTDGNIYHFAAWTEVERV